MTGDSTYRALGLGFADLQLEGVAPEVFDRFRRTQPGALERPKFWWQWHVFEPPPGAEKPKGERFCVLRRDASGSVDGFAHYRIRKHWADLAPDSTLYVDDLVALSDEAYADLWHHCLTVDWIRHVSAMVRPATEVLPQLVTDSRGVRQKSRCDMVWARILDPVAALAARTYRVVDRLTLEVTDSFGGTASGCFVVDGGPDGATCKRTDAQPDLTIRVADLGAAYLGGTPLWPAAGAGRVIEHTPGAVVAFDRMFGSDRPPWCNTGF